MDILLTTPSWQEISTDFLSLLSSHTYTVLYFYPKDNTSGCTIEARDFSSFLSSFQALGAQVIGVSKDSHRSHCNFIDKHDLKITLVSDPDFVLHKKYGAFGEKSMYGKKYMGTLRNTYILDNQWHVLQAWEKVKVAGHVQDVLDWLQTL